MAERIEYTADDEMPDCGKCDHICDDFDCCNWCGAEHGWWGYRRTEVIDIDKIKKKWSFPTEKGEVMREKLIETIGDRIRAMSDEELAKIICVLVRYPRCLNPTCGNCDQCPLTRICDLKEDEVLDWLHKPVEEE